MGWNGMGYDGMGWDGTGRVSLALLRQGSAGSGPASWRPHVPALPRVWNPFASPAVVFSQQGWSGPTGLGAAPAPWPICSLFIFLHLSITSQINTPRSRGQGAFPCQQRQDPALGVPGTPTPGMAPHNPGGAWQVGLGSRLRLHAQAMSPPCHVAHAGSCPPPCPPCMPDPPPGAARSVPRAVQRGTALPGRQP